MLKQMALGLLSLLCLAGAGAAEDGVIDVAASFEIAGPDPSTSGSIIQRLGIAETLVNADAEGRLVPGLATGWEVSADRLVWTFAIRPGVRFHDGTPLTAAAAAQALTIARGKPGLLSKAPIAAIEAAGEALVVRLTEPLAALPAFLAEYRSLILAPAAYGDGGAAVALIGTGPYRATELTPPQKLLAEAFPDYWGEKPQVPKVSYLSVSRAETRALMAESGEADFVFGLDPASVTRLSGSDRVSMLSVAIPRTLMVKVNAAHPWLSDPAARKALSLAIDRAGIAKAVLRYPEGATQLFPPSVTGWHDPALPPLTHDPAAAKALLAGLGWVPGADGILTRGADRFALTLTTYPDRPELPLVAAVLEQQFRAIGIEIRIDSTNSSEIPARHQNGTLELALLARNFALVPDPIGTVLQDYAPTGDWGAMGWQNDAFVGLARALARGEAGDAERAEAAAILQADLPVIPVAWYWQNAAVSTALKGASIDPWERTFGLATLKAPE